VKYLRAFLDGEQSGEVDGRYEHRGVAGETGEANPVETEFARTRPPYVPAKPAKQTGGMVLPVSPVPAPYPAAAFLWPDAIPGLGPRTTGPFFSCAFCGTGTWVRYGGSPRCLGCARDPRAAVVTLYRTALERWWGLHTQRRRSTPAIAAALNEVVRLMDEVGEPVATELRRAWAHQWYLRVGICPWCGERGEFHVHAAERRP
jgi:hypothetical protein